MTSLVYIHIGKLLPEYIYDSIYQSIIISPNLKIYILISDVLIETVRNTISNFNINLYTKNKLNFMLNVECIPLSILENGENYIKYINYLKTQENGLSQFRDGFWISTTSRFFYLERFIELFKLRNVFHIENDVMLYHNLCNLQLENKMYVVEDSPGRVIPSIIYIPEKNSICYLNEFILSKLKVTFFNDMQLLGMYAGRERNNNIKLFDFDFDYDTKNTYIVDGACIGQYLGGVDPRNLPNYDKLTDIQKNLITIDNPTKGFINETCTFKINKNINIFKKPVIFTNINIPLNLYYITKKNEEGEFKYLRSILNTHIHSKQLYKYSSIFDYDYKDIITGDRVVSLCDFVITTNEIFNFHKNLDSYIEKEKIIIVKDFKNVNVMNLNNILKETKLINIKLFIYTHIFEDFINNILYKLDNSFNYILYLHNSDHTLEEASYNKLLNCNYIKKVYVQNINVNLNEKFSLLPIGLANSMWGHGDIQGLYNCMKDTYYLKKTKNLYVNINPKTFNYRQQLLNEINQTPVILNITKKSIPFKEYLKDLSQHYFCLCVRGNGVDTHRMWESYYLGVIPVIINNSFTNMNNHVNYMRQIGLPFYEIKQENLNKYSDDFFNKNLYKKIIKENDCSMYNLPQLKLSYYS